MTRTVTWTWLVQSDSHSRADRAILEALELARGSASNPLPPVTRNQLKRLLEEGNVTLQGTPLKASSKLKPGNLIQIEFPPPQTSELIPEKRDLEILYEDEYLLVVNKPPGLTVHPSPTQMEGTLVHALLHHVQDLSGIGGILRPGIVHRIDKDTSGALVITKTDLAHARLAETFSHHEIERVYWAICYGAPEALEIPRKIESLIGRNPHDRKKMSMKVKQGRKAVTYFKTLEKYSVSNRPAFASLLHVTLETGRTHQIRVHLTGIGHSLLGDPVYGTPTETQAKWLALPESVRSAVQQLPGQALHARILGFKHPITGQNLRFEAKPPEGFEELLIQLRNQTTSS
jgi:23S rRNA pseudouridine1911/1915/1917 synthase